MFAEELVVIDTDSSLWGAARPLLDAALRLERSGDEYTWHGWSKQRINAFLKRLPTHCTLLAGVWEVTEQAGKGRVDEAGGQEAETLILGVACEVVEGEIHSIRTFEVLVDESLPPVHQLEAGYQHALELMRISRARIAPVAWAVFTDKTTWDEWILTDGDEGSVIDKGELLATLARQGRCVLMGSQVSHHA